MQDLVHELSIDRQLTGQFGAKWAWKPVYKGTARKASSALRMVFPQYRHPKRRSSHHYAMTQTCRHFGPTTNSPIAVYSQKSEKKIQLIKLKTCRKIWYTLSEAWTGVNWTDLMTAQGAFGTDFYERSTRTIVGTMVWTEYRPVIKIGPKGAPGCHEIRPIHSVPSLGQSIDSLHVTLNENDGAHP